MQVHPMTQNGASVLAFLDRKGNASPNLLRSADRTTAQLLAQMFVLAMRRSFSRDVDSERCIGCVAALIAGSGPPAPGHRSTATQLCRWAIDGSGYDSTPGVKIAKLVQMLRGLIAEGDSSSHELEHLVNAAEIRLVRLRRRQIENAHWWSRWIAVRRLRAAEAGGRIRANGPKTAVGKMLKAQIEYDRERVAALPSETSDRLASFVPREVARLLLSERFPIVPGDDMVTTMAKRVLRPFGQLGIRVEDAASVINYDLEKSTEPGDASPETLLRVRIAVAVCLADDLGLYEAEVDSILCEAETIVGYGPG